ncbi:class II aldolase/adducin family protein [Caloramator sp. E03]|nr:class II aldolase/adducin family protein [Caloramator sp. E03]
MLLEQQRKKIIEIALRAQNEKLIVLTFGNFSIRDKETGYICVTPSGMNYKELVPEDIVVVDENCNIIDGKRKPSIETPMHCAVYRKRKDVNGIVHTHSSFATAWACCEQDIPCVVAEVAALIGGDIKCAPYRPMGTNELADIVAETIGDNDAVLLAKHGALAVGPDIEIAFTNAVVVEEGAKVAYYAKSIGKLEPIPQEECRALRKATIEKYGQKYNK